VNTIPTFTALNHWAINSAAHSVMVIKGDRAITFVPAHAASQESSSSAASD